MEAFLNNPARNRRFFEELSAGQRIVLNIVTHLLANIKPRTLVLFDEPQTHLHPRLTATLVNIVLEILDQFDSFSIIATHSPIVVQQVPSRFVKILVRDGDIPRVELPPLECFGASLTELTRSLYGAAEVDRSYEDVVDKLLADHDDNIDAIDRLFDGGMGSNARVYALSKARREGA